MPGENRPGLPRDGFAAVVLALAALTAVLHVLGATVARGQMWGVHHYAFLPSFWLPAALAALAAGTAAAWWAGRAMRRRAEAGGDAIPDNAGDAGPDSADDEAGPAGAGGATPAPRRFPAALLAASLLAGLLFWFARVRHLILGDGSVLVVSLSQGERFHPRQPLTALVQHLFHELGGGLFGAGQASPAAVAQMTTALSSVVAGALAVPCAWLLARELVALAPSPRPRRHATAAVAVTAALLLSQGYALLYFGYVENYTWYLLAATAWLGLSLRALRRRSSLLPPAAALVLAILLHLSGVVLLPAFAVVAAAALGRRETRRAAARDLLAAAGLGALALVALARLGGGYSLAATLGGIVREVAQGDGRAPAGYFFSGAHLRDFANEQLLIGPLGLALFLPAAAVVAWRARRTRAWPPAPALFLIIAGASYLAASWIAGESNLGYARNWDLLAPGGLVFAAAGLGLFLASARGLAAAWPALLLAVPLSLFHFAPWVAVNASFDRSFTRLRSLPSADGITETNVGRWYLIQGQRETARRWFDAALAVNPNANNAHYLLGQLAMEEGEYEAAARSLARAVDLRPDKDAYREALLRALLADHRWPQAALQAQVLLDRAPREGRLWAYLGLALIGSGRDQEGRGALSRFRELAPADTATAHVVARFNLQAGIEAYSVGERAAAETAWREALNWQEGLVGACYNLGVLLVEEGRLAEARPFLARVLELAPDAPEAPDIRRLLEAGAEAPPAGRP